MKYILLQILGMALLVIGIQGAIRVLMSGDAGLFAWLSSEVSLLMAINVVLALAGGYLLVWAQKKSKKVES